METLHTILLVLQVLVAVSLIGLILIQHGKGADAGAAFGSGASSTVFGAQGSGNFLSRTTAVLAFIFLANSLALAYIASQRIRTSGSLMEQPVIEVQSPATQPADVVNEIPADPSSATPAEVPADPSAATTNEVPSEPAEAAATGETAAGTPAGPAAEPVPVEEAAPAGSLPPVEIDVPEVTVPAPEAQ